MSADVQVCVKSGMMGCIELGQGQQGPCEISKMRETCGA